MVTADGIIGTVAGNGMSDSWGDGGQATAAHIGYPRGVAVDSAGNLYIADAANNQLRKVTADGVIHTVAGNGVPGFSGDGGPATEAQLSVADVATDSKGNLYIADYSNSRVRMVTPGGVISTVAGKGTYGYSGDDGPATAAQLNDPKGIAFDSAGNLYIADYSNYRVRKVTAAGLISTIAGCGALPQLCRENGLATEASLGLPTGVAVDSAGSLYITEAIGRVRKVTAEGGISTIAGKITLGNVMGGFSGDGGPATEAQLSHPSSVAVDSMGNLYIADELNNRIRKITVAGIISTVAGNGIQGFSGDGGPATEAQLNQPRDVAFDSAGNLYIADTLRVRKVTAQGVISTVAGLGTAHNTFNNLGPRGVAVDGAGNLYISDHFGNHIFILTAAGVFSTVAGNGMDGYGGDNGPAAEAALAHPDDVEVDSAGNLFIADNGNHRVRKVTFPNCSLSDLRAGGATLCRTAGTGAGIQVGYAKLTLNSGAAPYGTAVFSLKQNGVTVSEAAVPASTPTLQARIFIDYRSATPAVPAHSNSGIVDINTGVAVVNHGSATAYVTYTLRNASGSAITTGHGTIDAGYHFACFIDQLKDKAKAPDFIVPPDFQTAIQFGSLEIVSTQPLSVLALRGTMNQRNEFLITSTPIADLTQMPGNSPSYFPQFADGGGYTTSLILLNTSNVRETGKLEIRDKDGNPLTINQVGGTRDSSFRYSIEPGSFVRFQSDGFPANTRTGWVRVTPDAGTPTPVGSGIFGYNPENVLVSESGIPAAVATTHVRVYVDLSGNHNTGLAIANVSATGSNITINAYQKDGVTAAGTSKPQVPLAANGQTAAFADEFVTGLPAGFTGVLDLSSTVPFAALTLRSLDNERRDFLMTTFPVADANQPAPSPIAFPQIADGGGYVTEIILLSAGQAASTTTSFYGENGAPLVFGK
jgi:sugar lactone lactonase YvrE